MKPWSPARYAQVVEALNDFALEDLSEVERARALLVGKTAQVREWLAGLFLCWLALGQEDSRGRRALDRFRERHPAPSPEERAVLDALAAAWCSLFEVCRVLPGEGLELEDLLGGERLTVRGEHATSDEPPRDSLLIAWVLPVGEHLELAGAGLWVPSAYLPELVPELYEDLARARARATDESLHLHLRRLSGRLCARAVALHREAPPGPDEAPPGPDSDAAPTAGPETWFAFKLGPIPLERGDVNAYAAIAPDSRKSSVVFATRDEDGLVKLARELPAECAVSCEPRLAHLGHAHGFTSYPLPGDLLLVRATLALAFAWGPAAEAVLPEHLGALLLASARLWRAAPWTHWEHEAYLTATLSGAVRGQRELRVLGHGGEEFGFVLFDEPGAHARGSRRARDEVADQMPCLALQYDGWPEFAAEAVKDATGMPYLPSPLRLTWAGLVLTDAGDVRLLTATARALCQLGPEQREGSGEAGAGAERVVVHVKAPPPAR